MWWKNVMKWTRKTVPIISHRLLMNAHYGPVNYRCNRCNLIKCYLRSIQVSIQHKTIFLSDVAFFPRPIFSLSNKNTHTGILRSLVFTLGCDCSENEANRAPRNMFLLLFCSVVFSNEITCENVSRFVITSHNWKIMISLLLLLLLLGLG